MALGQRFFHLSSQQASPLLDHLTMSRLVGLCHGRWDWPKRRYGLLWKFLRSEWPWWSGKSWTVGSYGRLLPGVAEGTIAWFTQRVGLRYGKYG
jgi:hypothetical protein